MGHVRPARPEGCLAWPVVQALAQALNHALAGQAGQRLRHGGERHADEVGQPPETLAAGFDPRADGLRGVSTTRPDYLWFSHHSMIMTRIRVNVKFYNKKT